eukprot:2065600-Pleurochrysis_carterae.AAC.3
MSVAPGTEAHVVQLPLRAVAALVHAHSVAIRHDRTRRFAHREPRHAELIHFDRIPRLVTHHKAEDGKVLARAQRAAEARVFLRVVVAEAQRVRVAGQQLHAHGGGLEARLPVSYAHADDAALTAEAECPFQAAPVAPRQLVLTPAVGALELNVKVEAVAVLHGLLVERQLDQGLAFRRDVVEADHRVQLGDISLKCRRGLDDV